MIGTSSFALCGEWKSGGVRRTHSHCEVQRAQAGERTKDGPVCCTGTSWQVCMSGLGLGTLRLALVCPLARLIMALLSGKVKPAAQSCLHPVSRFERGLEHTSKAGDLEERTRSIYLGDRIGPPRSYQPASPTTVEGAAVCQRQTRLRGACLLCRHYQRKVVDGRLDHVDLALYNVRVAQICDLLKV